MKLKSLIVIILGLFILIAGIFAINTRHSKNETGAVHPDIYYCPMHPTYTSPKPGNCPICNMKLVKRVETPPQTNDKNLKQICILHNCSHGHDGQPCPMMVISKDGKSVSCPICGTHLLKNLDGAVMGRSRISLNPENREWLGITTGDVEIQKLVKEIRSFGIVSDTHNIIEARINQNDLPLILKNQVLIRGLAVSVTADALVGQEFIGETKGLSRSLDPVTHTSNLRCIVHDPHWDLRPGMYVNVVIKIDLGSRLSVDRSAIFQSGERAIVFVDLGKGQIEPREIKTGVSTRDHVEVLEGLVEGDVVLTSANFLIDSESQLKAAIASITTHGGQHENTSD